MSQFRYAAAVCLLWLGVSLISTNNATASTPHFLNGSEGLMVATLPPPGFYYRMYNLVYSASKIRNGSGDRVNLDQFSFLGAFNVHRFIYSSNLKILGGNLIADVSIPLAYLKMHVKKELNIPLPNYHEWDHVIDAKTRSFGLSDIIPEALIAWHTSHFDVAAGVGFFLPTGRYNPRDPTSPGKGYLTISPGFAFTYYFDQARKWNFAIGFHYEFNFRQRHTGITPGQQFHFEWGLGRQLGNWQLGVTGYNSWQITRDRGTGASAEMNRANAIGPEIVLNIPKLKAQIQLRSLWEFKNRAGAQGNMTACNLTFTF